MKHKKYLHPNDITICKESFNCKFGNKCWFKHDKNKTKNNIANEQTNDIMENIFELLEKFTEKITSLENKVKTIEQTPMEQ